MNICDYRICVLDSYIYRSLPLSLLVLSSDLQTDACSQLNTSSSLEVIYLSGSVSLNLHLSP